MGTIGHDGYSWRWLGSCMAMLLALSGLMWLAPSTAGAENATGAAPESDLRVESGWVRAMPPGQPVTAAFMVLVNKGDRERRLEGMSSPLAGRVELHRTMQQGDRMRMEAVTDLAIAPGESVTLEPGGLHLMLMELQRPLKVGEQVPLLLTLDRGEQVSFSLPVVDMRHQGDTHRHSQHHH